jgi:uncharacterized protein YeaO (DUF488 family)
MPPIPDTSFTDIQLCQQPNCTERRIWPRGLRKESAGIDSWAKDVAPSTELRTWFGHDPDKWEEFQARYTTELDANPQVPGAVLHAGGTSLVLQRAATRHWLP